MRTVPRESNIVLDGKRTLFVTAEEFAEGFFAKSRFGSGPVRYEFEQIVPVGPGEFEALVYHPERYFHLYEGTGAVVRCVKCGRNKEAVDYSGPWWCAPPPKRAQRGTVPVFFAGERSLPEELTLSFAGRYKVAGLRGNDATDSAGLVPAKRTVAVACGLVVAAVVAAVVALALYKLFTAGM